MKIDKIRAFILDKTKENAMKFGSELPTATEKGTYTFSENGFWVGGFWTGINYLCYELSGDEQYLNTARSSQFRFIKRLYEESESLDHDIGYLYSLSLVADYKITGNTEARRIALDAADLLSRRYNNKGRFIQAWNVWTPGDPYSEQNKGRIIIDCMYNLPLLFWASEETGDERYRDIAIAHAHTCAKTIIREDFTTYHTFVLDPISGEPLFGQTHQGYSDSSCWSRGQAWALGGYAHVYRYSGNKLYLELAKKLADVYLCNLEEDGIPMWDFSLPDKAGEPRDSSAAAIAAAGLLEIASHETGAVRERYEQEAERLVCSLFNNYSTLTMRGEEGMLIQACGNKPKGQDENCSLIYGDYYFTEAVARLLGKKSFYW